MAEPHHDIAAIEAELDELAASAERSRKLVLAGKLATAAGGIVALLALVRLVELPPAAFLLGLAGLLGGIALAGSSASSLDEARARMADLERRRAELIDGIGLRVIEGGRPAPSLGA